MGPSGVGAFAWVGAGGTPEVEGRMRRERQRPMAMKVEGRGVVVVDRARRTGMSVGYVDMGESTSMSMKLYEWVDEG